MAVRLETSRLMVYRYAWQKSTGQDALAAASMAKLHVSECFVQNSLDAVRVFGAAGYAVETGLERDLRDSVGSVIFSGRMTFDATSSPRTFAWPESPYGTRGFPANVRDEKPA